MEEFYGWIFPHLISSVCVFLSHQSISLLIFVDLRSSSASIQWLHRLLLCLCSKTTKRNFNTKILLLITIERSFTENVWAFLIQFFAYFWKEKAIITTHKQMWIQTFCYLMSYKHSSQLTSRVNHDTYSTWWLWYVQTPTGIISLRGSMIFLSHNNMCTIMYPHPNRNSRVYRTELLNIPCHLKWAK